MYVFGIKMASHFKWYPSDEEVTVPFFARYSFPSQVKFINKIGKQDYKINSKNSSKIWWYF